MHNWFECKIKYQKIDEASGKDKTVKEAFLIDAVSFTEAEARTYRLLEQEIGGEFTVTNISPAKINEVFYNEDGDIWFKAKVVYIDADEASGKERKSTNYMLVFANNLKQAIDRLEEGLREVLIPWNITSIQETTLIDIFPYHPDEEITNTMTSIGTRPIPERDTDEEVVYEDDEEVIDDEDNENYTDIEPIEE